MNTFSPHTRSCCTHTPDWFIHTWWLHGHYGFQVITRTAILVDFTTAGIESVSWALICGKKKDGINTFHRNAIVYDVVWFYTALGGLVGAKNLGYWSTEGIQFLKYLGEITFSTCFSKTALPSGASERHVRAYNIKIKPQKFKPHSTCVYITQEITNWSQQHFVQHWICNK